jgi:hypothetical protein
MVSVKQEIPDMKSVAEMKWMLWLLAVAAVPGCATHALWADSNLGTWHQPSSDSQLHLFQSGQPGELLVLYQESTEPHDARRMRAYLLYQNAKRIAWQKHPKFVKIDDARGLEPVPIFAATNATDADLFSGPPLYAVLSTNKMSFTLYSSGTAVGAFSLPVYRDGMGRMERIALTPLAATADATIIGGAIGVAAGYLYVVGRAGGGGDIWPNFDAWKDAGFLP